jgi:DoxX-like protein
MRPTRKTNALLWTVQVLLALLFLFAGVMKLIAPLAELERQSGGMSGLFLKLIGLAEALGAIGLIAPGLAKIGRPLTPLAAGGLLILMVGAVVLTLEGGVTAALVPLVVGALCALVAYGRWRVLPVASR